MATVASLILALEQLPPASTIGVGYLEGDERPRLFAGTPGEEYEVLVSDGPAVVKRVPS